MMSGGAALVSKESLWDESINKVAQPLARAFCYEAEGQLGEAIRGRLLYLLLGGLHNATMMTRGSLEGLLGAELSRYFREGEGFDG